MKLLIVPLATSLMAGSALADNLTVASPLTMEQLMRELRIQGGNFVFTFEKPIHAKITVTTMAYPQGAATTEEFISDQPSTKIDLFFSASAMFVGDYARGDATDQPRKMLIKLSDCKATEGTRVIYYSDKFAESKYASGQKGIYDPCLPVHPELNKEYVLHDYFRNGDPYEAKATICFLEKLEDASKVKPFDRNEARAWKSVKDSN